MAFIPCIGTGKHSFIFEIDFYTFEMTYIYNLCIALFSLYVYTVYNHMFYGHDNKCIVIVIVITITLIQPWFVIAHRPLLMDKLMVRTPRPLYTGPPTPTHATTATRSPPASARLPQHAPWLELGIPARYRRAPVSRFRFPVKLSQLLLYLLN